MVDMEGTVAGEDTTAVFTEDTAVDLMEDTGLDFMEADSMEDPAIMAVSALAWHIISPYGAGIILGTPLATTRNTTTTFLRKFMINPLLLRHLPLNTLSLHQLLKVLVLAMFYLLHLRPARFHQI
jgi:hypothetical protein